MPLFKRNQRAAFALTGKRLTQGIDKKNKEKRKKLLKGV